MPVTDHKNHISIDVQFKILEITDSTCKVATKILRNNVCDKELDTVVMAKNQILTIKEIIKVKFAP